MPKPLPTDTVQFLQYSPYFVLTADKSPEQLTQFDAKYDAMPEPARRLLLSPEAADLIIEMESQRLVPSSHAAAVSKLLGMVIMEDVRSDQVRSLLTKLGLPDASAATVADRFAKLLEPLRQIRAIQHTRDKLNPLPPLTQRLGPPTSASPAPSRVIDLRTKPPTT